MSRQNPRFSMEETARMGDEWYERQIRPKVEKGNEGKIVAIDIETGDYALGATVLAASKELFKTHPDAEVWCVRIGHNAVFKIG